MYSYTTRWLAGRKCYTASMKSPNVFERMLNKLNAMSDEQKLLGIAIMTGLFLLMLGVLAVTVVIGGQS